MWEEVKRRKYIYISMKREGGLIIVWRKYGAGSSFIDRKVSKWYEHHGRAVQYLDVAISDP